MSTSSHLRRRNRRAAENRQGQALWEAFKTSADWKALKEHHSHEERQAFERWKILRSPGGIAMAELWLAGFNRGQSRERG